MPQHLVIYPNAQMITSDEEYPSPTETDETTLFQPDRAPRAYFNMRASFNMYKTLYQKTMRLCKVLLVIIGGLLLLLLLKEVKYGHNIEINIENAPKVHVPIAVSPIAVSNSSPIKVSPDVDASPIEVEINRTKILEHEDSFVPDDDSFKYYSIDREFKLRELEFQP